MESTNLLVIIFLAKLFARNPIFTYIRQKYGQDNLKLCRSYERLNIRHEKINDDLLFLSTCKKEGLIPKFAKPKLSIDVPYKIKKKIAKLIIKTEIANTHAIRKKIKKDLADNIKRVKSCLSFICLNGLRYQVGVNVKNKKKL